MFIGPPTYQTIRIMMCLRCGAKSTNATPERVDEASILFNNLIRRLA
jgi:hypothetical protein